MQNLLHWRVDCGGCPLAAAPLGNPLALCLLTATAGKTLLPGYLLDNFITETNSTLRHSIRLQGNCLTRKRSFGYLTVWEVHFEQACKQWMQQWYSLESCSTLDTMPLIR